MKARGLIAAAALAALASLSACGSNEGNGGNAYTTMAASRSVNAFWSILTSAEADPCFGGSAQQCPCPGGGTVAVQTDGSFAFDACMSSSLLTFTGSATSAEEGKTLAVELSVFGECFSGNGTVPWNGCGGSLSASCTNDHLTCTFIQDEPGGDCNIDC